MSNYYLLVIREEAVTANTNSANGSWGMVKILSTKKSAFKFPRAKRAGGTKELLIENTQRSWRADKKLRPAEREFRSPFCAVERI